MYVSENDRIWPGARAPTAALAQPQRQPHAAAGGAAPFGPGSTRLTSAGPGGAPLASTRCRSCWCAPAVCLTKRSLLGLGLSPYSFLGSKIYFDHQRHWHFITLDTRILSLISMVAKSWSVRGNETARLGLLQINPICWTCRRQPHRGSASGQGAAGRLLQLPRAGRGANRGCVPHSEHRGRDRANECDVDRGGCTAGSHPPIQAACSGALSSLHQLPGCLICTVL